MSTKQKSNQTGFSHIAVLVLFIAIIGVAGFTGWRVISSNKPDPAAPQITSSSDSNTSKSEVKTTQQPASLIWQQTDGGWKSAQTPPACASQPIMKMPADLSKASSILYPGQTRGGNYKPHGGVRFDAVKDNKVTVTAPIDGFIVRGGSYLAEGEIQYTFDVMNNCGVMYRVGHFRVLPDRLQKLADTWPQPQENDSRTHFVNPALYVAAGETLATTVGITKNQNTFFDWGVYDYRQQNEASKSASYQAAHAQDKELSWHAVCWFDWVPAKDSAAIASLPAGDPASGKNSDYCK
jgi:hypothetical protein